MAWNTKKIKSKFNDFFKNKKISYSLEEDNRLKFKFEICLDEAGCMIYPYVTISNDIVSFNVNVSNIDIKTYDYSVMNSFNLKSKLFKAYYTNDQIIVLEYRFLITDELIEQMDMLIDQLFLLQYDIDRL